VHTRARTDERPSVCASGLRRRYASIKLVSLAPGRFLLPLHLVSFDKVFAHLGSAADFTDDKTLYRSLVGLFCSLVGLFCSLVGLFCSLVGLFCSLVGLFCSLVGLFCLYVWFLLTLDTHADFTDDETLYCFRHFIERERVRERERE
jgi:hypothetical protein